MHYYDKNEDLFRANPGATPTLSPISGVDKLWEMETDNSYLKYLYPKITRQISEFVENECDKMEYEGSLMFDLFPDKTSLQIMAAGIANAFKKENPDVYPEQPELLRDMIEVVLFHEIMYRRNRYRNHKRLYL